MTQNTNDPSEKLPVGQLLQILIVNDPDLGLQYHSKWFRQLDPKQQYIVAETCDRILRSISPVYAENVARVDHAAQLGFAIAEKKPLLKMVLSLVHLRGWEDADDVDGAPQE